MDLRHHSEGIVVIKNCCRFCFRLENTERQLSQKRTECGKSERCIDAYSRSTRYNSSEDDGIDITIATHNVSADACRGSMNDVLGDSGGGLGSGEGAVSYDGELEGGYFTDWQP